MSEDPYERRLFEMRLSEIYSKHSWLSYELTLEQFIRLFPISYKNNKPVPIDKPANFDLDKNVFLEVLVAFKQSFK
ncbi:hypothetical protein [Rubrolithibacter danxiaensis]|uniref:hypothetical protein n=1 Tax=Rubrolithibacter danxiaensis TaxID=3390805 RepID=UPI003BF7AE04